MIDEAELFSRIDRLLNILERPLPVMGYQKPIDSSGSPNYTPGSNPPYYQVTSTVPRQTEAYAHY